MIQQPIINIGCLGSVSNGKSTLVEKLTGTRTQRHSNEKIRNITIKQGYANMKVWFDGINYHTTDSNITYDNNNDDNNYELINHISFVDCPGHQELIQTMLASISLMDGAIIIIAADLPLNKSPQLIQHLAGAKIGKIKKIIICLNKIDLVSKTVLFERKEELDKMLLDYDIKSFAIIPTCFNKKIGLDNVVKAIVQLFDPKEYIERNNFNPIFKISRTFDINKPGTNWNDVKGGVMGGSLTCGKLKVGDEIEIRPGLGPTTPLKTKILSIKTDLCELNEIIPGGLVGIGTDLDPYYCKNDVLSGHVVGLVGSLPPVYTKITMNINLITLFGLWTPKKNDLVMLQIGTKMFEAKLIKFSDNYEFELTKPACIDKKDIIICRNENKILKVVAEGTIIN
jgi:translation initiation factor 2 subunit 3